MAYDGDKVQCHVCGKWFKAVGQHIKGHRMTTKEYRDTFGFHRYKAPLCSPDISEKVKMRDEKRLLSYSRDPEIREKNRLACTGENSSSKRADVRKIQSIRSNDPELRAKIAAAQLRPETREKHRQSALGKIPGPETRVKMAEKCRQRNLSLGDNHPSKRPELRERLGAVLNSPEAQEKARQTRKSPEYRAKISERMKKTWEERRAKSEATS